MSSTDLNNLIESRVTAVLQQNRALQSNMFHVNGGSSSLGSGSNSISHTDSNNVVSAHTSASEISQVAFKSPQPLYHQNPTVWFTILEQQFQLSRITLETTRFSHAVSALDARLHNMFADVITRDKGHLPYSVFKEEVIRTLGESEKTKLNNVLHGLSLGDQKPSQLLAQFRMNARNKFPEESIKQLWLKRLPNQVQLILAPFENDVSLSLLAERADSLMETISQLQINSVQVISDAISGPGTSFNASHSDPRKNNENDMDEKLARFKSEMLSEISLIMDKGRYNRRRSNSRTRNNAGSKRSSSRNRGDNTGSSSKCYYHRRYGKSARKCISSCPWHAEFISDSANASNFIDRSKN